MLSGGKATRLKRLTMSRSNETQTNLGEEDCIFNEFSGSIFAEIEVFMEKVKRAEVEKAEGQKRRFKKKG